MDAFFGWHTGVEHQPTTGLWRAYVTDIDQHERRWLPEQFATRDQALDAAANHLRELCREAAAGRSTAAHT